MNHPPFNLENIINRTTLEALDLLLDRIGTLDFAEFIGGIVYLTELQKEFYISYLNARRRHLFGI